MADATKRQKQFLRQLGHKSFDGLTKERASALIDELLKAEKVSGKIFPCPYCKKRFGPRPRRTKKRPSCGQSIIHLTGKFYTEEKADELYQKEWLKDARKDNRENVRDDWRDERSFRKDFDEVHTVGYIIQVGPACTSSQHLNGLLVMIEDANDTPEFYRRSMSAGRTLASAITNQYRQMKCPRARRLPNGAIKTNRLN